MKLEKSVYSTGNAGVALDCIFARDAIDNDSMTPGPDDPAFNGASCSSTGSPAARSESHPLHQESIPR
jgi:hypothetical protein